MTRQNSNRKKRTKKMTVVESKILTAFKNFLKESLVSEDSSLQDMMKQSKHDSKETSHLSQFSWEGIDDAFKLKVAGSPFEDAITSAFFQVHSHKYLDDPTFRLALERELKQRAVPPEEISKALEYVEELKDELKGEHSEQDYWNSDMESLVDVTTKADSRKAESSKPFTGGGLYPDDDKYDKGSIEGF